MWYFELSTYAQWFLKALHPKGSHRREDANCLLDAASVLLDFLSLSILAGDLWLCGCVLIC